MSVPCRLCYTACVNVRQESTMSHHPRLASLLLTGITLALSACATGPDLDVTIHESERGAVYVERIPDRSFHAAHPVMLPTDTMARVLRGVVVKDNGGVLGNLLGSKPEIVRAFEDKDVEYLAPLLVEGLSRAASDQQVGFRVMKSGTPAQSPSTGLIFCQSSNRSPGVCDSEQLTSQGPTEGSLYAYRQSLYLTVTQRPFNSTGSATRTTVHFVPESAKRPDSYRTARSTNATLVIDYDMLAAMPAASDIRSIAAQPPTSAKGEPTQRDSDLNELRKELRDIKKKLTEQEEERTRSTPSVYPKPTPQSIP